MINVLHVCTDFWPITGGIQSFVRELSKSTQALGVASAVFCCNGSNGHRGKLPETDSLDGVPITRASFLDLRFYKPTSFSKARLKDYDLIHVHGVGAQLDYLALLKNRHRRPIILSTHGAIFHTPALRWLKLQYFYRLQPLILKKVDLVAACSPSDECLFKKISARVQLVENGVDIDGLLALPMGAKVPARCLYVGRLAANKDIDALLRMFAHAKGRGAIFELRIVGPAAPGERNRYEALAEQIGLSGSVQIVGAVDADQLTKEYAAAAIFVSASRYEGFGISAIEARSAGCRLLLQRNDAFTALFGADSGATLVDYQMLDDAGEKLMSLLKTAGSGDEGGRASMARYSWGRKAQEWLMIYRQVLAPKKAA
jgi:alpha-1,3-mannosyltransferase